MQPPLHPFDGDKGGCISLQKAPSFSTPIRTISKQTRYTKLGILPSAN